MNDFICTKLETVLPDLFEMPAKPRKRPKTGRCWQDILISIGIDLRSTVIYMLTPTVGWNCNHNTIRYCLWFYRPERDRDKPVQDLLEILLVRNPVFRYG